VEEDGGERDGGDEKDEGGEKMGAMSITGKKKAGGERVGDGVRGEGEGLKESRPQRKTRRRN
jgi:hypothetical protein